MAWFNNSNKKTSRKVYPYLSKRHHVFKDNTEGGESKQCSLQSPFKAKLCLNIGQFSYPGMNGHTVVAVPNFMVINFQTASGRAQQRSYKMLNNDASKRVFNYLSSQHKFSYRTCAETSRLRRHDDEQKFGLRESKKKCTTSQTVLCFVLLLGRR